MSAMQLTPLEEEYLAHTQRYGGSVGYGGAVNGGTSGGGVTTINSNGSVSTGNVSNLVGVKENSDGSTTRTYQNPDGSLTSQTYPNEWGQTTTLTTSTANGFTTTTLNRGGDSTIVEVRNTFNNNLISSTVFNDWIKDNGVVIRTTHTINYGSEYNTVFYRDTKGIERTYNVHPDGTTFDHRVKLPPTEQDRWNEIMSRPAEGPEEQEPDGTGGSGTSTTAGIEVGAVCACASDIREHAADVVDATQTNAPRPQTKAAAPTPDARASGALPAP